MPGVLDVFSSDAFSLLSLTDAINKVPFIPGRAGQLIDWNAQGVPTTSIMLEEIEGTLKLIDPTGRGGPGVSVAKEKRTARILAVPHYQIDDAIYAEEVQNVREFGQEQSVRTVQNMVNTRNQQHANWLMDPTIEYQRIGAIKGIILNGGGSTLFDLFDEFDVTQEAEVDMNLGAAATGAVRTACAGIKRLVSKNLGGQLVPSVYGFCSDSFWDALIADPEVRATYLNQQEAAQLRGNSAWEILDFGGIRWENYRGEVGGTAFIAADKAHIFPIGVPGLWRTIYSPADYNETVNTIGLPRYAKQFPMPNDKGINMELQTNSLSYNTKPKTLIKAKIT